MFSKCPAADEELQKIFEMDFIKDVNARYVVCNLRLI